MNAQTTPEQMMTAAAASIRQQVIAEMQQEPPKVAPFVTAGYARQSGQGVIGAMRTRAP